LSPQELLNSILASYSADEQKRVEQKSSNEPLDEEPKEEIKCQCEDHLETKEFDIVFPVSCKFLFDLLFGESSKKFWENYHETSKRKDIVVGEWLGETRECKYMVYINTSIGNLAN
jgi:hypothetical protein